MLDEPGRMSEGAPEVVRSRSPESEDSPARPWAWTLIATLVFGLALASLFNGYVGTDLTRSVLLDHRTRDGVGQDEWATVAVADLQFVVGLTSRHAHALLTRPHRLFQLEHCYPAENALAFGEPVITLGVLGLPAYWLTRDPVLTFNIVLVELALLAAVSMFLLVRSWTGSAAAAIVAGLLFSFHDIRARDVVHAYALDSTWTVLALFFATQLFRQPRWRDALGLGVCCALQIWGSFYPLLAAVIIAPPLWLWLLVHYGPGRLSRWHWGAVVIGVVLFAGLALSPYVMLEGSGVLEPRGYQAYMPYSWLWPGEKFFSGWVILFLVPAALALGRKRCTGAVGGDPRWALLFAGLLVTYLAAGGTTGQILHDISLGRTPPPLLPDLYKPLASIIPGLAVVRAPAAFYSGTHAILCILSGLGAAAVLRICPRKYVAAAAAALILAAYVDTLRPETLGLEPRFSYVPFEIRPESETLALFDRLEAQGNVGPVLEIPVNPPSFHFRGAAVLTQAYHRRPTSQCYNSFTGPLKDKVIAIAADLPSAASLRRLRSMGFTTLVVHHSPYKTAALREKLEVSGIRRIAESASASAYSIDPSPQRPSSQSGTAGADG